MIRLVILLTLLVPGVATAAETEIVPPTFFDVNGGSVTTPALEAGKTYRVASGGTFKVIGPNITFDHDSIYCYGDDNPQPICRDDPSPSNTGLWAGYQGQQSAPFYQLQSDTPPKFNGASNRYSVTFVAARSAPLRFAANTPELNRDYQGQLGVAVYRVDQAAPCSRAAGPTCAEPPTPLTHMTKFGELVSYEPPPPGQTETARGPVLPADAKSLFIDVDTTVNPYALAVSASNEQIERGRTLCGIYLLSADYAGARSISAFFRCVGAVTAVLERCRRLKESRGGPGVCGGAAAPAARIASADGCTSAALRPKGSRAGKLKVKCIDTDEGTQLQLAPRRKGAKLRSVLGKRPRLVIGTPYAAGPTTGDRVTLTWNADY